MNGWSCQCGQFNAMRHHVCRCGQYRRVQLQRAAAGGYPMPWQPNRVEAWAQRPHRGRDWTVRAALVGWWLLTTSIIPPTAPLLLILIWWALMFGGAMLIWKGYKHLTWPTYQHGIPADPLPERYQLADRIYPLGRWATKLGGATIYDVIEAAERDAVRDWEHRTHV